MEDQMVSARVGLRQVCGTTDELEVIDFTMEVHLIPYVIAQGNGIHSGLLDLVRSLRGDPRPTGCVFAIGKDQIGFQGLPNSLQARFEKSTTGAAHDVTQYQDSHDCLGGFLIIAKQAVVNEEYDIIPSIAVEIQSVTLPGLESRSFLPLIVEVFLKYLEVKNALPLLAFFIIGKEFQKMPASVNAKEIRFAIVIEVAPINCRMFDFREIGQITRFDLQIEPSPLFVHELERTVPKDQQRMSVPCRMNVQGERQDRLIFHLVCRTVSLPGIFLKGFPISARVIIQQLGLAVAIKVKKTGTDKSPLRFGGVELPGDDQFALGPIQSPNLPFARNEELGASRLHPNQRNRDEMEQVPKARSCEWKNLCMIP